MRKSQYPTVPGCETSVPILTLGDDLAKLTINGGGKNPVDPVAEATRRGNAPTLGDVKKSVKVLGLLLHLVIGLISTNRR